MATLSSYMIRQGARSSVLLSAGTVCAVEYRRTGSGGVAAAAAAAAAAVPVDDGGQGKEDGGGDDAADVVAGDAVVGVDVPPVPSCDPAPA